ncbi:MAG: eukaryotic-like serine/threonine-protein kinase [Desulfobacteraceae bacterium Eth-SRB2]|nr:MAG: eukaryotic-like serine/threonine-protein kinase [Desulfobacteraceae bacterium Eth-SRB2]
MAFSKVVTSTFFIAKEWSTIFMVKTGKKLFNIRFVQRNRIAIACGVILWTAITLSAYTIYDGTRSRYIENLYRQGANAAKKLAAFSSTRLIENDILAMNAAIRDFSKKKDIEFVAILDHQDIVVAHSNPEMINHPFHDLSEKEQLNDVDGVTISSGKYPDGKGIILFSENVVFSKVNIGKIHLAISKTASDHTLGRYQLFFFIGIVSTTLLLAIILFLIGPFARARAYKSQKEVERMGQIGPYILRKKIGQGGMAELFLADYVGEGGFRKTVAVKKVLPHLLEYPQFSKMFIREARLVALLQHPNIVQVIDFKRIDNASFIAMEYIHGKTLGQLMVKVKDKLPFDLCVFLMVKVSSALHYAHSRKNDATGEPLNIIHRDICPQNLLLSYQGEVKLSDFGISKAQSETSLTLPGVIKGKVSYMAPEQLLGEPMNHQADIYSLGVIFYEILTGRKFKKFDSTTQAIDLAQKGNTYPIEEIGADFPNEVNQIVMKCLETDPALRYQSAQMLKNDLALLKKQYNIICDESNLAAFLKEHFKEEAEDLSE